MKGDKVEIVIDAGGATRTYEVTATRAGRRVEIVNRRGLVEVSELTRGGGVVRTARFMASRVLALVEHPAQGRADRAQPGAGSAERAQPHAGSAERAQPDSGSAERAQPDSQPTAQS